MCSKAKSPTRNVGEHACWWRAWKCPCIHLSLHQGHKQEQKPGLLRRAQSSSFTPSGRISQGFCVAGRGRDFARGGDEAQIRRWLRLLPTWTRLIPKPLTSGSSALHQPSWTQLSQITKVRKGAGLGTEEEKATCPSQGSQGPLPEELSLPWSCLCLLSAKMTLPAMCSLSRLSSRNITGCGMSGELRWNPVCGDSRHSHLLSL